MRAPRGCTAARRPPAPRSAAPPTAGASSPALRRSAWRRTGRRERRAPARKPRASGVGCAPAGACAGGGKRRQLERDVEDAATGRFSRRRPDLCFHAREHGGAAHLGQRGALCAAHHAKRHTAASGARARDQQGAGCGRLGHALSGGCSGHARRCTRAPQRPLVGAHASLQEALEVLLWVQRFERSGLGGGVGCAAASGRIHRGHGARENTQRQREAARRLASACQARLASTQSNTSRPQANRRQRRRCAQRRACSCFRRWLRSGGKRGGE